MSYNQMSMAMPMGSSHVMQQSMTMPQLPSVQPYNMSGMIQEMNSITPSAFVPSGMPLMGHSNLMIPGPQMLECTPQPQLQQWLPTQQIPPTPQYNVPERTEIHVTRLPHDMRSLELNTILSNFGEVVHMHLKKGRNKEDKRTSATAKFSNPIEAARAIQQLNGQRMGSQVVEAKYDRCEKSTLVLSPPSVSRSSDSDQSPVRASSKRVSTNSGPLVVDGSRSRRYDKHSRKGTGKT